MRNDRIEDIFPLTSTQAGLLFHCLAEPGAGYYWTQFSLDIHGPFEPELFQQAWSDIAARHAGLRTVFVWKDRERPLQIVSRKVDLPWLHMDWSGLTTPEQESSFEQFLKQDRANECDLGKAPLMRFALIKLGADRLRFVWSHHHLILDGWSLSLALNEALDEYDRLRNGLAPASARRSSMREYVDWLSRQSWNEAETHFRSQLAGFQSPTPLIIDATLSSPPNRRVDYAATTLAIDAEKAAQWTAFARAHRLTLNTLMQAGWGLLLHRYSGEKEVMFGVTLSGRSAPVAGIESAVGLFINTLPLHLRLDPMEAAADWLQKVQVSQAELLQFQHTPLTEVHGWSAVPRNRALFESIFVFENYPIRPDWQQRPHGVRLDSVRAVERSNYPLMLSIGVTNTISVIASYDAQRLSRPALDRMLHHYERMIDAMVAEPSCALGYLPLLAPAEKLEVLSTWNQTTADYPKALGVHELFQQQAARAPKAIAVVFERQRLTYQQLDLQSTQLARNLQEHGVGPGELVALCVERSAEMVVALLGILKAGGAYLPLDPTYPQERLAFILDDARPRLLLTQRKLNLLLPTAETPVAFLEDLLSAAKGKEASLQPKDLGLVRKTDRTYGTHRTDGNYLEKQLAPPPAPGLAAGESPLAYVLYTSGSTGKPKGVAIEHRGVINFLNAMRRAPGLKAQDVLLAVTTLSFDIAGLELFLPLTTGATVVVLPWEKAADGEALIQALRQHRPTIMQATPATWHLLLEAGWKGSPKLKILCGGEALQPELARRLLSGCAELWNMYGPTETTIWSTCCRVTQPDDVPIGRPIDNTELYILDSQLQPVPVGVPGELLIGGEGLARGYLNRPELTAQKFIPHPLKPGKRLYRTGDLARYRPDGNVECLGRLDNQIKIRGFRIELGEIEAALAVHSALQEVVVAGREDSPGDKRLVAYMTARNGSIPSPAELRDFARRTLPDYMIPSAFVVLPSLPRTPNGKIDRKALPAVQNSAPAEQFIAPRDPLEEQLAGLWRKIFNLEQVGIRDNFFQLGGHSLLAVRLFSQLQKATGRHLPMVTLFQAPTIEQLAALLRQDAWKEPWSSLVPIKASGNRPPFYCVHGIGGNILEYLDLAKYMDPDQPFYGLQAAGLDGKHAWHNSVPEMAAHYLKEIRSLQPSGPYCIGGASFGGMVAYEMAQQLLVAGERVQLLAMFDTWGPGYPKPIPSMSRWTQRTQRLKHRITLHWDNLCVAQGRERLDYAVGKALKWCRGKLIRLKRLRHRAKAHLEHWRLPKEIKQTRQVAEFAAYNYKPAPYSGRVTLFRATEQPPWVYPERDLGWGTFALGGIEIFDMPGHHGALVRDPRARALAARLQECLKATQAAPEGSGTSRLNSSIRPAPAEAELPGGAEAKTTRPTSTVPQPA